MASNRILVLLMSFVFIFSPLGEIYAETTFTATGEMSCCERISSEEGATCHTNKKEMPDDNTPCKSDCKGRCASICGHSIVLQMFLPQTMRLETPLISILGASLNTYKTFYTHTSLSSIWHPPKV